MAAETPTAPPPAATPAPAPLIPAASAMPAAPSGPPAANRRSVAPPSNLREKMDALANSMAAENEKSGTEGKPLASESRIQPGANVVSDRRMTPKAPSPKADATPPPATPPAKAPEEPPAFKSLVEMLKGAAEVKAPPVGTEFSSPEALDKEEDEIIASGGVKDRTANAFKHGRIVRKSLEAELAKLKSELETAKNAAPKVTEPDPETKELIEEGRAQRWLTAPETQREVREKYDPIIAGHDTAILDVLSKNALPDSIRKEIVALGGWKGLISNQALRGKAQEFYNELPWEDQKFIDAKMAAMATTEQEKNNFISQGKANAAKLLAEKGQRGQQQTEQQRQQSEAVKQGVVKWTNEMIAVHPVFKKIEIPATATKQQREILEKRGVAIDAIKAAMPKLAEDDPQFKTYMAKTFLDTLSAYETIAAREFDKDSQITDLKNRLKAYETASPGTLRNVAPERRETVEEPPKPKTKPNVALGQSGLKRNFDDAVKKLVGE